MKVRCIRLINPNTGKQETTCSWLSVGKIYHVLSIFMDERKTLLLRLIGDDCVTPALHDMINFEIASPILPSNWIVSFTESGVFEIAPRSWMRLGFWEDYFDRKEDAVADFEKEKDTTIQADP